MAHIRYRRYQQYRKEMPLRDAVRVKSTSNGTRQKGAQPSVT